MKGEIGRDEGHEGYWKDKKFDKPSVFVDIKEWIGWSNLEKIIKTPKRKRDQALLCLLFKTGARASEIIQYRSEHFREDKKLEKVKMKVENAPLVKNEQLNKRWPYTIPKNEPLNDMMVDWIENKDGWLFPSALGSKPFLTRQHVWMVANKATNKYPHWFRSQRAFCLSWFHDFAPEELQAWFTWTDAETPQHYARPSPKKYSEKFRVK